MCLPKGKKSAKPYPNWVESKLLKAGRTETALIDGEPVWTSIGELGPDSDPAHEGVDKGLISKTYRAEAKALSYSKDVRFESAWVVRTDDLTAQNHANTVGRVFERGADTTLNQLLLALELSRRFGGGPWRKDVTIVRRGNVWVIVDKKNKVIVLLGTQEFRGPGATPDYIRRATQDINNVWSGTTTFEGEQYNVRSLITGSAGAGDLQGANDIYVGTDNARAWQSYYGREGFFGSREDYGGRQDISDVNNHTPAHEFGHALGIPDEYTDQKDAAGNVFSVPHNPGSNDLMGYTGPGARPSTGNYNSIITGSGLKW
jgi:hypothetical protein